MEIAVRALGLAEGYLNVCAEFHRGRDHVKFVGDGLLHGFGIVDRFAVEADAFNAHVLIREPQAVGAGLEKLDFEFLDFCAVDDAGGDAVSRVAAPQLNIPAFAAAFLNGEGGNFRGGFGINQFAAHGHAIGEALLAVIADTHDEGITGDVLVP